jgi:ectoine hydroxylase-related dioxygenase (phytanoyl-CoA dioxygenase family)
MSDTSALQTQTSDQTVPLPDATKSFDTPENRQFYQENGYVVLRGVISQEILARLQQQILEEYDRQKKTGTLFSGGGNFAGHLNCFPGEESRQVYNELEQKDVITLVKALFPGAVRLPNVGCNLNLPGSVTQHYHTDYPFTREFIIVNIAVVDTDLANGAIDVLPGTHKRYYKFWQYAVQRLYKRTTRLPLKRGDVLIRTSNLWHRGMPNHTQAARPMLAFTWEEGGSTKEDPFGVNDGKISFWMNWFKPNFIGRLRERTFIAAPITYSAARFVLSLYGKKGY